MQPALIDICGTLFKSNTTFDFLDFFITDKSYHRFRKLMKKRLFLYFCHAYYKVFNVDLCRKKGLSYLKGISHNEIEQQVELFYNQYLESRKIEKVWSIISPITEIYLISGTIEPIAKITTQKIGAKGYIASILEYKNDICTGKLIKDTLRHKEKYLNEICLSNNYSYVITDNYADKVFFDKAERVIAIAQNKRNEKRWRRLAAKMTNVEVIVI